MKCVSLCEVEVAWKTTPNTRQKTNIKKGKPCPKHGSIFATPLIKIEKKRK